MSLLERIWNFLIFLVSLVSPFAGQRPAFKIAPGLRLFLHGLVIFLILTGLWAINRYMPVRGDQNISMLIPDVRWARDYWLPILFLLLYALAVTGWWIYRLLMAEPEATDFPDIDEAWDEAVDALDAAGVPITEVPVFVVLGRPEAPEEHFFQAAQLNLIVKGAPIGARHPLHVYASREGVFITCAGCSLLGKQAGLLALEGISEEAGSAEAQVVGMAIEADATLKPGHAEQKIIKNIARMVGTQMNGLQKRALRRQSNLAMPNLLASTPDVELMSARFAHLCRLIVRDRQPYCPINGILVLVPLGATDTELEAQRSAELCHLDLNVIRRVMKVRCPMFAMVVDMEQLPGFSDFIHRRTASERSRRIGQRFPLNPPDLHGPELQEKLGEAAQWLGHNIVRDLVHRVFKTDPGAKLNVNHDLFLMLDEMRERKDHLARFLKQGLARDDDGPLLFGGCYLGATGVERDKDQAFVRGVLARLSENQNYVSWTDQALADDARSHTVTWVGYILLAVIVVALGGGVVYYWRK
jgi:hypothetical protein